MEPLLAAIFKESSVAILVCYGLNFAANSSYIYIDMVRIFLTKSKECANFSVDFIRFR